MLKDHIALCKLLDRYGNRKTTNNKTCKPRSGRPQRISVRDQRYIFRKIKENPKISAPKIAAELANILAVNVSPSTVRNCLRNNEFHSRVARKKYGYIS